MFITKVEKIPERIYQDYYGDFFVIKRLLELGIPLDLSSKAVVSEEYYLRWTLSNNSISYFYFRTPENLVSEEYRRCSWKFRTNIFYWKNKRQVYKDLIFYNPHLDKWLCPFEFTKARYKNCYPDLAPLLHNAS